MNGTAQKHLITKQQHCQFLHTHTLQYTIVDILLRKWPLSALKCVVQFQDWGHHTPETLSYQIHPHQKGISIHFIVWLQSKSCYTVNHRQTKYYLKFLRKCMSSICKSINNLCAEVDCQSSKWFRVLGVHIWVLTMFIDYQEFDDIINHIYVYLVYHKLKLY